MLVLMLYEFIRSSFVKPQKRKFTLNKPLSSKKNLNYFISLCFFLLSHDQEICGKREIFVPYNGFTEGLVLFFFDINFMDLVCVNDPFSPYRSIRLKHVHQL